MLSFQLSLPPTHHSLVSGVHTWLGIKVRRRMRGHLLALRLCYWSYTCLLIDQSMNPISQALAIAQSSSYSSGDLQVVGGRERAVATKRTAQQPQSLRMFTRCFSCGFRPRSCFVHPYHASAKDYVNSSFTKRASSPRTDFITAHSTTTWHTRRVV